MENVTERIAIDFGTSHTAISAWEESSGRARLISLPGVSMPFKTPDGDGTREIPLVPSIIRYSPERCFIGIKARANEKSTPTKNVFRNMKRYISSGHRISRLVHGKKIGFHEAGADFLEAIIHRAIKAAGTPDAQFVFSIPTGCFEQYRAWIGDVCETAGVSRWRVIDEATACSVGYGGKDGDRILVFDFGGGTVDVAVVRIIDSGAGDGRGSIVLGKSGCELGGMDIDAWIMDAFLREQKLHAEEIVDLLPALRDEAERVKIALSFEERAVLSLDDPEEGKRYSMPLDRLDLREILDHNRLFDSLRRQIDIAMERALDCGVGGDDIDRVCMVGGSGLIPSVRDLLYEMFGARVAVYSPFEAVSIGAGTAGVFVEDHIQHQYALRHWNPGRNERRLKVFIPSGTKFPSERVACFKVAPSRKGQDEIELAVFEVGSEETGKNGLEIVYGESGCISLEPPAEKANELPLNASNPTFIKLRPPAENAGSHRIDIHFDVDERKMLLVTVEDRQTGLTLFTKQPVIRLI